MNEHAIVAWMYVRECCQECPFEASKDYDFIRLVINLTTHYRCEFDAMDSVMKVLEKIGNDVY